MSDDTPDPTDETNDGTNDSTPETTTDTTSDAGTVARSDAATAPGPLARLRAESRERWAVTAVAVAVGLGLAWVHWLGVIVGAAAVALPQRSFPRGVLAGLGFGVVVFLAHVVVLATTGPAVLDTAVAMQQVFGVSAAVSVIGGLVGGLVRGVV